MNAKNQTKLGLKFGGVRNYNVTGLSLLKSD